MKKYNRNWSVERLTVNFNHKQWRQDIGAFIKEKKNWDIAVVTRSKAVDDKGSKMFEISNNIGDTFKIQYRNQCDIDLADDIDLVNQYLEERS